MSDGPNLTLTQEQSLVQQAAREFARNEIAPVAAGHDRSQDYPWEVVRKAQELGFTTMNVAEAHGGSGFDLLLQCVVWEELAWACSGIQTALAAPALAYLPIAIGGTDEQKARYGARLAAGEMAAFCLTEPEAGSDVVGIKTSARESDGDWILEGTKTFVTGATVAGFYTVFARTDPQAGHRGITAFVVDREWDGVNVGSPFEKMGQRASDTAPVMFADVRVPASRVLGDIGRGFQLAMRTLDRSRTTTAAAAVGVAQRAFDEASEYARNRTSMGVAIGEHQAIGHLLAQMLIDVEAARLLTWKAALQADSNQPNVAASFAKSFAADTAERATTNAVQVFGGYGYMAEYPVEKLMRDAKIFQIYEGTSQIQREIITRSIIRR